MDNLTDRDKRAQELAGEILTLAVNTLTLNMRFMDRAIGNLKLIPDMNCGFASGASGIRYSPWTVVRMYMNEETLVTRNLLHSILHNVLRHSFIGEGMEPGLWDLAADIAVENAINEMGKDYLRAGRESAQHEVTDYLKKEITWLTAERIYSLLRSGRVPAHKYYGWHELFEGDDHSLWYGKAGSEYEVPDDADLEELWKDISEKMQAELESLDVEEGALTQNIRDINRVRYDYTEFLRKFMARTENMKLSEEEFDLNYYTYGMDLYGNIPLIEPIEYRDDRKIHDLVIAIDTSGSVEGEVVQKFLQHTHDMLTDQHAFDTEMNIYILQCDDKVRDAARITSAEDLDRYFKEKKISGLGRTDFRPVFEYVNALLKAGQLKDLKGLLYFTDGKGRFPAAAPAYETAFIIHNDSPLKIWVPDWAMKIEMQTGEIMDL